VAVVPSTNLAVLRAVGRVRAMQERHKPVVVVALAEAVAVEQQVRLAVQA
jgi:hypothetical protein